MRQCPNVQRCSVFLVSWKQAAAKLKLRSINEPNPSGTEQGGTRWAIGIDTSQDGVCPPLWFNPSCTKLLGVEREHSLQEFRQMHVLLRGLDEPLEPVPSNCVCLLAPNNKILHMVLGHFHLRCSTRWTLCAIYCCIIPPYSPKKYVISDADEAK